jgi:hypothetical protein
MVQMASWSTKSLVTHHDVRDGPVSGAASAAGGADVGNNGCDAECILCPYSSTSLPGHLDDAQTHLIKIIHKHSFVYTDHTSNKVTKKITLPNKYTAE